MRSKGLIYRLNGALAVAAILLAVAHVWLHAAHADSGGHFGDRLAQQCLLHDMPPATLAGAATVAPRLRPLVPLPPRDLLPARCPSRRWSLPRAPPSA